MNRKKTKFNSFALEFNRQRIMRFWRDALEAIAGSEQDFTKIPLGKAIFLLSLPMVLEMVMESVFVVVDIFFVSKLGAEAVAVVGLTESMMTIVYAIAVGLSTATTAIVSRRIGEKNKEGASVASVQAITAGLMVSLVISVIGFVFASDLLRLMGASEDMMTNGAVYPMLMLGGNSVIMLLFIINAVFRSAGDAAISMRVLWLANLTNIILDPCLIFGIGPFPELGLGGAALATNIGRGIAVIYQLYLLFRGNKRVKLVKQYLRINLSIMKRIFSLSLGSIGQSLIATSSWIVLMRIVSEFGSTALAGYTIAIRILIFALLPAWGISNAASTLVGQNLGAKEPGRAENAVWITGLVNMAFIAIFAVLFIINPDFFIGIFIDDIQVIKSGTTCLQIISYGFLFYSVGMVLINAFNGAGDTTTPTLINFICFWIIEVPLAYLLAIQFDLAVKGVSYAIVFAESMLTLMAFLLFKRGKWKKKEV